MVQSGLTALDVEREHQLILYFSLPLVPHSNFVPKVSCVEYLALILRSKHLQINMIFESDWLRLYEYVAPVCDPIAFWLAYQIGWQARRCTKC
jgi:hypothetical protein